MYPAVREDSLCLGIRTKRLRIVDYYTVPWEDVPASTPRAVMIAIRDVGTGKQPHFAWHLIAEEEGIPPCEILEHQDYLERRIHQKLQSYLAENPRAWWVHWGLDSEQYGLSALAQRAKALGLREPRFPEHRIIDCAQMLKKEYGYQYVPHNRLRSLIQLNGLNDYHLLAVPELTAAFRAGEYARMLLSLRRKVCCIGQILDLHDRGDLRTSATTLPALFIPSDLQKGILQALQNKALTQDALATKLNVDRGNLYRDGIRELQQRGLVRNNRRVGGYYRPDAPPEEYREVLAAKQTDSN